MKKNLRKVFVSIFACSALALGFSACSNIANSSSSFSNDITSEQNSTESSVPIPDSSEEVSSEQTHTHTYSETIVQPTCTSNGFTIYTCSCEHQYTGNYTKILGHEFTNYLSDNNATCTANGTERAVCNRADCQEVHIRTVENSILGHEFTNYLSDNNATCTANGTERAVCNRADCQEVHVRTVKNSILGHDFSAWKTITNATVLASGMKTRNCSRCTEEEKEAIPQYKVYFTYTVEDGKNLLDIAFEEESEFSTLIYDYGDIVISGTPFPYEEIDVLRLGENVTSCYGVLGYAPNATRIVFSPSVKEIASMALYPGDNLREIHFEGDAPQAADDALVLNGGFSIALTYTKGAKGFDGLILGGQMISRENIPQEIPEMTLQEFAQKTAKESVVLAQDILDLYYQKGQQDLLYMPYHVYLEQYAEIKDFTLELTKNCQTTQEKIDVIYDYIVDTIIYDDNATFFNPYEVFTNKAAVCGGYVGLMHDMLSAVDVVSFYTRGMTLFGNYETLEKIVTENYSFSTHAWLTVFGDDGSISFYDPTWGVSDKETYRAMTVEELGSHAMTFEVEFLKVLIDEMDFTLFGGDFTFIYDNGYIYTVNNHILSGGNNVSYNAWLCVAHEGISRGAYNVNGAEQPIRTMFNNGIIHSASLFKFAKADGRILLTSSVYNFLHMQETRYGKETSLSYDAILKKDGMVYHKRADNTLSLIAYTGIEEELTVPSTFDGYPVLSIGESFLHNNKTVKRVIVSEGITTINWYAFHRCALLEYIYLPATLEVGLFNQYNNTTNYDLLFVNCPNLKQIEVAPENDCLTSVDGHLYNKDMSVIIRYAPAQSCDVFTLPDSVTAISFYAFYEAQISHIVLHDGLQLINENSFQYSILKEIVIPANCEIRHSAFAYCANLRRITIKDGIEEFGESLFTNCYSLSEIHFPSTLKKIPFQAFVNCNSLHEMRIPEGVTTLAEGAFAWSGITFLTLPSTLTTIGADAFFRCERLYHINNLSNFTLTCGSSDNGYVALNAKSITTTIDTSRMHIQDGFVFYLGDQQNYLVNYVGEAQHLVLPDLVNGERYILDAEAFAANCDVTWMVLTHPDELWTNELCHIGKYVESITIPNTITYIPDYCFAGWISITTIYYKGTAEEWQNFEISKWGHNELRNAEVQFI